MTHRIFILLTLLCLTYIEGSCRSRDDAGARATIETFIKAWQKHDIPLMEQLYPEVKQMDFFYSSDRASISEVSGEEGNLLRIYVNSTFVTTDSREVERQITFIVMSDPAHNGVWSIRDSYGLACWERYPYYTFAQRTGCVSPTITTSDVELSRRMGRAKQMIMQFTQTFYEYLSDAVRIVDNRMTRNDGRQTEGFAVVVNESEFLLPSLDYSIIFYNDNQQEVGRHTGHVTESPLQAGERCTFQYAAKVAQGAAILYFVLDFDVEMIVDFILEYPDYTGGEYDEFMRISPVPSTTPNKQGTLEALTKETGIRVQNNAH